MADHEVNARRHAAEMLDLLLADGRVVYLSRDDDGLYTAEATSGRGAPVGRNTPRNSSATDLEGCIEGLTDAPRERTCLRCGATKRLWAFGPDRDSADGHAGVCKACEAKRVNAINRRKKAGEESS